MTFAATKGLPSFASEKSFRCACNPSLLCQADICLRRSLYVFPAGLHFYKMYSICCGRDDIYLKMPDPEVSLKDSMSFGFKQSAGDLFSSASGYLSFISAIFHSLSTFFSTAIFSLVFPHPSPMV